MDIQEKFNQMKMRYSSIRVAKEYEMPIKGENSQEEEKHRQDINDEEMGVEEVKKDIPKRESV